jgi:hypothetical protein
MVSNSVSYRLCLMILPIACAVAVAVGVAVTVAVVVAVAGWSSHALVEGGIPPPPTSQSAR